MGKITVKLFKSTFDNSFVKAYGSVTFNDQISINVNVFEKKDGSDIYFKFPEQKTSKKDENGRDIYKSQVFVKDADLRAKVLKAIKDEYQNVMGSSTSGNQPLNGQDDW